MNGKETRKEHELRRWLLQQDNASEAQHIVGWSDDSTMTWFKHADGKPYRSPISRGLREFLNKHASYGPEERGTGGTCMRHNAQNERIPCAN